jgi:predicted acyltransferase
VPAPARDAGDPDVATPPKPRPRERLKSLDVFRGMTVAGMLLVNNPGTWSAIYEPLEHAPWNGWTPTDLIFPFFLFIVGITTHLSLTERAARGDSLGALRRQVVRRGLTIVLIGMALSAFPFFQWNAIPGNPSPSVLDRIVWRVEHLRIMGVLQRIGWSYLIAGLLTLQAPLKRTVGILVALLFGYWAILTLVPTPGTGIVGEIDVGALTLQAWVDQFVLGTNHIFAGTKTYDPEGILSTLGAVASVITGVLAGRWIATRERPLIERVAGLFGAGAITAVIGLCWHWSLPINKNLWTPSYVVFMSGMGAMSLATCMWLIEELDVTAWTGPFLVYGMNPIVAFVGSGLMARCIYTIFTTEWHGKIVPVQKVIFESVFLPLLPVKDASLLFAATFVMTWFGILSVFHRKRWFLKV